MLLNGLTDTQNILKEFATICQRDYPKTFSGMATMHMDKKKVINMFLGDDAIQELLDIIKRGQDANLRMLAVDIFANPAGEGPTLDGLLCAMEDEDNIIRGMACGAIATGGRWKSSKVVKPLIARLTDKDINVREAAASSLGLTKSSLAIDPLIEALRSARNIEAWLIAKALNMITRKRFIFGRTKAEKWLKWRESIN